jgi:hypothetical protein
MMWRGILDLARGDIADELGELDGVAGALQPLGHASMMP